MKRTVFIDATTVNVMRRESEELWGALVALLESVTPVVGVFLYGNSETHWPARIQYVSERDRTRMLLVDRVSEEMFSFCSGDVLAVEGNIITFLPIGAKV